MINFKVGNKITKADLFREYARILDLVEGTSISPNDCVKFDSRILSNQNITFTADQEKYEFAVGIIENKSVFPNDIVYDENGKEYKVNKNTNLSNYSLTLPKPKQFTLNNKIYSKPESIQIPGSFYFSEFQLDLLKNFYWKSMAEKDDVFVAFVTLLGKENENLDN